MFQVAYWFFLGVIGIGFLALFFSLCEDVIRQQKTYNEEQKRRKARARSNKRMKKEIQEEMWKDYPTGQVAKEEKHAKNRRGSSRASS
jgi:phosphate/sulfate permease